MKKNFDQEKNLIWDTLNEYIQRILQKSKTMISKKSIQFLFIHIIFYPYMHNAYT